MPEPEAATSPRPKGAYPPKISAPESRAPSRKRMAHSAVRTRAGARRITFPVSRASSRIRAAFVLHFSLVAMASVSFASGLVRPVCQRQYKP